MKSSESPSLSQFIHFLSNPASFPDPTQEVKLVQTHASVVAIGDEYVYKLKKNVNFGFLDFSTLEKRKFYCEEEVRLNQRLTQGIYLGVLPIYWNGEGLSFEEDTGSIVNYVVKMKRMLPEGFLINRLGDPKFGSPYLDPLIQLLVNFYQRNESLSPDYLWPENMKTTTDENFNGIERFIGKTIAPLVFQILREDHEDFLRNYTPALRERQKQGKVKDCHGDMHAEHVYYDDQRIHLYDCIEFNTRFRQIDQLADIAFLVMDLDYRERSDLANYFRVQMLKQVEEQPVAHFFNFFLAYRAIVRGKVNSMKTIDPEIPAEEQAESQTNAARYFNLALRYTLLGAKPTVVVIVGGVATGKSTLARSIAAETNLKILNTDIIRKELVGLEPAQSIRPEDRSWLYTPEMIQKTYDEFLQQGIEVAKIRGAVVLDAGFRQEKHLHKLIELCQKHHLELVGVQTYAPEALVRERLQAREGKSGPSDMRLDTYQPERDNLQYQLADFIPKTLVIDTSQSIEELLPLVLEQMKRKFRG